jgi:hypothetical protein
MIAARSVAEETRLFAFFLDDYHVREANAVAVREPLTRFIRTRLQPTDMIAVMYPLTPVDEVVFTRDHESVIRTIQSFRGRKYNYLPQNRFEENYVRASTQDIERIRVAGETSSVPAGTLWLSTEARPPLRDPSLLEYSVETRVESAAPRMLTVDVLGTNATDRHIYLEHGECALRLRAFRTPERTDEPVWRSEYRRPVGSSSGYVCPDVLVMRTVAPRGHLDFNARIPVPEVLGDSLPDGRYYISAQLVFRRGSGRTLTEDTLRLAAGSADLTSRVDPLPRERGVGRVHYAAEVGPDPATDGMLRATLSATNVSGERVLIVGGGSTCPVRIQGYRSAARRDRWYLERRPDWSYRPCVMRLPPTWVAPGETRLFESSVPADSGGSPAGRYYTVLVVSLEQEPGAERHRLVLSAGEATLIRSDRQ